jgi:hypothetical protein
MVCLGRMPMLHDKFEEHSSVVAVTDIPLVITSELEMLITTTTKERPDVGSKESK